MSQKLNDSCTPSNAAQDLARNFGKSTAALRSGVERQIDQLGPSGSKSDQVGRQTAAPQTFNVRQLLAKPTSHRWAEEFAKKSAAAPGHQRVDQWANEFRFNMQGLANELPNKWADEFKQQQQLALGPQQQQISPQMHEQWSQEFDKWIETTPQASSASAAGMESAWEQVRQSQDTADQWANEFAEQRAAGGAANLDAPTIDSAALEAEFDKIFQAGMNEWSGIEDLNDDLAMEYQFAEQNPHLNTTDPSQDLMQQAQAQIRAGNTQEAILMLEAKVHQNPRDAAAWCQLGFCHAENEHDIAAMSAFKKSLEVEPDMRDALLGYSVSLANENYNNEALKQLEKWLAAYTKMEAPVSVDEPAKAGFYGAFIDPIRFEKVEARYLSAARAQTNADPELQNALGILYNLNGTFDRAVDSIKTAIARNPDDPRLWNRLGATLANSDRTAEAIEAYRHALQLFPAYVRARYNLGISCMHLNCHREAADHFLSALRLQKSPEQSPIWSTLRSALIRMNKTTPHVMDALNRHDIDTVQQALTMDGA